MEFLKKITWALMMSLWLWPLQQITGQTQNMNKVISQFQQSYLEEASGDYQKAIDALREVYDEKSYEINLRLGWLTYQRGLFTESIAYYNKAVSLMPYAVEPRFGLVYPASAMGNWNVVIAQYEKILEICPNQSVALHRLGLIYYGREDYHRALPYFEKVVNLYPFDYDALIMLGWTKLKLNRINEASVLFQKALMHTPGGSSALEGLEQIK